MYCGPLCESPDPMKRKSSCIFTRQAGKTQPSIQIKSVVPCPAKRRMNHERKPGPWYLADVVRAKARMWTHETAGRQPASCVSCRIRKRAVRTSAGVAESAGLPPEAEERTVRPTDGSGGPRPGAGRRVDHLVGRDGDHRAADPAPSQLRALPRPRHPASARGSRSCCSAADRPGMWGRVAALFVTNSPTINRSVRTLSSVGTARFCQPNAVAFPS